MKEKDILIVGIDPGVTIAYAILGIDGKLLKIDSSKSLGMSQIISETMGFGKAVAVGTDKEKIPGFVDSFATKIGAVAVKPDEDLKVEEKRHMTENFEYANDHEQDALASALFAYKSVRQLIDKVEFYAEKNNKAHIKNRICEIVITKKISIRNAVDIIEKKDEPSKIIENVVVERKISENDFLRLFEKLKNIEAEMKILRNYNNKLRNLLKNRESAQKNKFTDTEKIKDFRERRISSLESSLFSKQKEIERLKSAMQRLNAVLSRANDFYILKKLDTLGLNEFEYKNKVLGIRKNDMLLVENPNIVSSKAVEIIKDKVYLIACRIPVSRKIENELPFVFIDASKLSLDEDRYFAFADKKQLESEKNKSGWINKIIEDYKKEKELYSRTKSIEN